MQNSTDRMDYICGYLSAYENKIKMANKQGLFDAAKMFELFAANICTLWFGQQFNNLNIDTSTYPYVDLISDDEQLFVQVTTTLDLVTKVRTTLEKLRDSKDARVANVRNVIFFALHNQSVDRIPEYTGANRIGKIPFTRKDNLKPHKIFCQRLRMTSHSYQNYMIFSKQMNTLHRETRNASEQLLKLLQQ